MVTQYITVTPVEKGTTMVGIITVTYFIDIIADAFTTDDSDIADFISVALTFLVLQMMTVTTMVIMTCRC